jgi:hypothetical protein
VSGELSKERGRREVANDSREVTQESSGVLYPRGGLNSGWIGLDAIGQGSGALGTASWTKSSDANVELDRLLY